MKALGKNITLKGIPLSEAPSNLVEFTFNKLQEKIINSTFKAGEKLVISGLAKDYGISAIPIREALAKLNAIGLIEFKQNQGYRVAPLLSRSGFIELFETRLMLDLAALPRIIQSISDEQVTTLRDINNAIADKIYGTEKYEQFQFYMNLNSEFHRKYINYANNRFLNKLYDDLYMEMFISRHIINSGISFDSLIHSHNEIVDALQQRDAKALKASLTEHATDGLNLIFGYKYNMTLNVGQ